MLLDLVALQWGSTTLFFKRHFALWDLKTPPLNLAKIGKMPKTWVCARGVQNLKAPKGRVFAKTVFTFWTI